jgi:hypothetical protein
MQMNEEFMQQQNLGDKEIIESNFNSLNSIRENN